MIDTRSIAYITILRVGSAGLILCTGVLLCIGCGSTNNSPEIISLRSQADEVLSSDSCVVECIAADADGDILQYTWSATAGTFSGKGASVTWTAPQDPGVYSIEVTVSDDNGGRSTMQLDIIVMSNQLPIISNLSTEPTAVGLSLNGTIKCFASDPDGDVLTYSWKADAGTISGHGAEATWRAPDTTGNHTITVYVTDGRGGEATQAITVEVLRNNAPIITSLRANPAYVVAGRTSSIECIAYDPDEDKLHYRWEASSGDVPFDDPAIEWTAPANCSVCTITVTVSDGRGGEASKNVKLWVRASGG